MAVKRFQDDQRYLVRGKTLNDLYDQIQTGTLLKGPGYDLSVVPGSGTTLRLAAAAAALARPWDMEITDPEAGKITIKCGTIIRDAADLTTALDITGETNEFTAEVGHIVRIKIAGTFAAPTATLESAGDWTGHPSGYQTDGTGSSAEFVAHYYPLWRFIGAPAAATVQVGESVYAQRLVGDHHFLRTMGVYHKAGDRAIPVPALIPYHCALL